MHARTYSDPPPPHTHTHSAKQPHTRKRQVIKNKLKKCTHNKGLPPPPIPSPLPAQFTRCNIAVIFESRLIITITICTAEMATSRAAGKRALCRLERTFKGGLQLPNSFISCALFPPSHGLQIPPYTPLGDSPDC